MSNSYEYIISNGVKIKLETEPGLEITTLLLNNGGLYVCDFTSIEIILPEDRNILFNSESIEIQAMFLYQLVLEGFLIQQPYEVFISENNDASVGSSYEGDVVLTSSISNCLFNCGAQLQKSVGRTKHYKDNDFMDYTRIKEKCNSASAFQCPFCEIDWRIYSLRELTNHIRCHHPAKGYLDFLE